MGSFSIYHWIILFVVVVLVFGTGKIKTLGRDLGQSVKGFKEGLQDATSDPPASPAPAPAPAPAAQVANGSTAPIPETIDVRATEKL